MGNVQLWSQPQQYVVILPQTRIVILKEAVFRHSQIDVWLLAAINAARHTIHPCPCRNLVPVPGRIGALGLVADNFMSARGCQLVWKWKSVELELARWILR